MSYTIVITKTETVKKVVGKDWEKLGQIKKEDGFVAVGESKTYISDEYGYTPEIEKSVECQVKVLEQTVEYLDLNRVIIAINGLKGQK